MKDEYLLAENTIGADDLQDLVEWLQTNPWLTQGELVREFERAWAHWLGVKHAVFVNSGSSANLLMYYAPLASGRLRNRKVVAPAVSWATTVAPAVQLGFEPVLCDAEPDTLGVDPDQLESILRRDSPALVIIVHVLGAPCDLDSIRALRERYGFMLLEDACAATGSTYDGVRVGTFGDMSSFSFFFGHHLSTIEGGMVCTNDDDMHRTLVQLRAHGWSKDIGEAGGAGLSNELDGDEFNRRFTFYHPGFNLRSTDLNARLGLHQMKKLDEVVARRMENHRIYAEVLGNSGKIRCQRNERAGICSIAFGARASSREHRAAAASKLTQHHIETRPVGGGNISRQPFWASRFGPQSFPVADDVAATAFQLPNHPAHSPEDIRYICETVLSV